MKTSQPFARANAMMGAIASAMSLVGSFAQQTALAAIPAYESRGKGMKSFNIANQRSKGGKRMASVRAAHKARNVRRFRAANR